MIINLFACLCGRLISCQTIMSFLMLGGWCGQKISNFTLWKIKCEYLVSMAASVFCVLRIFLIAYSIPFIDRPGLIFSPFCCIHRSCITRLPHIREKIGRWKGELIFSSIKLIGHLFARLCVCLISCQTIISFLMLDGWSGQKISYFTLWKIKCEYQVRLIIC